MGLSSVELYLKELDDLERDEERDGDQVRKQEPEGDEVNEEESDVVAVVALCSVQQCQVGSLLACTSSTKYH